MYFIYIVFVTEGPLGDGKGENNIPKTRAQKRKQSEKQTNASPQQKLNTLSDSSQRVAGDKKRKINKNNMDTAVKQGKMNHNKIVRRVSKDNVLALM